MTSPFVAGSPLRIAGAPGGPLAGLTFAAKDLFDVAGHPTGGGNPDWARQHPVPSRHAWAVQRLLPDIPCGEWRLRYFSPTVSRKRRSVST